jgi:aryl-alcohol dehydrogenase-like predicted oxidoreductase
VTGSASPFCPGARSAASRTPPTSAPPTAQVAQVAHELHATAQQVTLAWELAQSPVVIPIPGSSRPETIHASAAATDLQLTTQQLDHLNQS